MAEYIEREALILQFNLTAERSGDADCPWDMSAIETEIEAMPSADVAPVVRCKDCRNGKPCRDGYVLCSHPAGKRLLMTSSDFCSYGKRKGGED